MNKLRYLLNTQLVFNTLYKLKEVGPEVGTIFLMCKHARNGITADKIHRRFNFFMNKNMSLRKISEYLNYLTDIGYLHSDSFYFKTYALNHEEFVTKNIIFGVNKNKKWITKKNVVRDALNCMRTIPEKRTGIDGEIYHENVEFKFFQPVVGLDRGFGDTYLYVEENTLTKFKKKKYNNFFSFINEEIVTHIWKNVSVTKYDISRVLHISKYTINNFSKQRLKVMIQGKPMLHDGDNYHYNFDRNLKITIGNKYIKENETSLKSRNRKEYCGTGLRGAEKYINEATTVVDKLNQRRSSTTSNSFISNFNRNSTREFCTDWKKKYLIPKLDNLSFIHYIKNRLPYRDSVFSFSY